MDEILAQLLTPEQLEAARQRALTQGLMGSGFALLQASQGQPGQGRPSLGSIVGRAGPVGMQAYESSFDKTLQDTVRAMQIREMQRKQQQEKQLQSLLPQLFQTTRTPETREMIASEQGDDYITRPGQVTGVRIDPAKLQALMMVPGGLEQVKGIAEAQKLLRQSGLTQGAEEVASPFAPYFSAQNPEVRKLAETYDKGFKSGTIDEETAYKRIESLSRLEDSFVSRQEAKADRELQRDESRREREMVREERRLEGTEGQRAAAGYAERMVIANTIANQLPPAALPTVGTSTAGGVPLIGSYLQRKVMSPEQQLYKQAADDWIRAKLRKESGAVIGEEEMAREYETYFPQPGDEPQVIKQKEAARATAISAMIKNAGATFKMPEVAPRPNAQQPTIKRYNPATGKVE